MSWVLTHTKRALCSQNTKLQRADIKLRTGDATALMLALTTAQSLTQDSLEHTWVIVLREDVRQLFVSIYSYHKYCRHFSGDSAEGLYWPWQQQDGSSPAVVLRAEDSCCRAEPTAPAVTPANAPESCSWKRGGLQTPHIVIMCISRLK